MPGQGADEVIYYRGRTVEKQSRPEAILFKNARIFDGVSDKLAEPQDVLVVGKLIKEIGKDLKYPAEVVEENIKLTEVDLENRTLMPGLIDMHSHIALQEGMLEGLNYDQMAMGATASHDLLDYLQQGFTSCRDAGGNVLGIANAVANDRLVGPRIFPCGAFISQTGGHGDTGTLIDAPGDQDSLEKAGLSYIVDGRAEVLKACRNNLRNGATQIKIMVGGGCASAFDPIHTCQFTLDEIKAACEVASDYGTYVMCHAYHDESINRFIDAGGKCVEHGFLMSEETIIRMKKEGIAFSLQAVMSLEAFGDPDSISFFTPQQREKAKLVNKGAKKAMQLALKHDLILVSGGDMFGDGYQQRQADNIIWLLKTGMTSFQALKTATSTAGMVMNEWTKMSKYQDGPIGIVKPGAYADIIVVDGNPLENIELIKRDNIKMVVKDGKTYKYTLSKELLRTNI